MKAIKITAFITSALLAVSLLCACSFSKIEKARKSFISKGYEASEISDGDYPAFSAGAVDDLPRYSYIDCGENEVALELFEKNKESITKEAGDNVEATDGKSAVFFTGTSEDGIIYKVAAFENIVLFAAFDADSKDEVDEMFNKLGFN